MDPAHIPYAHHSLQGVREDGSPIEMAVLANNFTHVEATFKDICNGKQRDGVLSFQRPAFYHFRTRNNDTEYEPRLLIYTAPVRSGVCRTMIADFNIPVPKFLSHAASNRCVYYYIVCVLFIYVRIDLSHGVNTTDSSTVTLGCMTLKGQFV